MKKQTLLFILKIISFLTITIFSLNTAYATNTVGNLKTPLPNQNFTITVTHTNTSQWGGWDTATIDFKNNSAVNQNIDNAVLEFTTPTQVTSVWGNFPVYPDLLVSSNKQNDGSYKNSVTLKNPSWHNNAIIVPPSGSFNIVFSQAQQIDPTNTQQSVKIYTGNVIPTDAKITLIAPTTPGKDVENEKPQATISGPSGIQKVTIDSGWNSKQTIENLPYGDYIIHTASIGKYQGGNDTKFSLDSNRKEGSAMLTYLQPTPQATLNLTLTLKPDANAPGDVDIKLQNVSKNTVPTIIKVNWGNTKSIDNLTPNDQYKLWTDSFTISNMQYTPSATESNPFIFKAQENTPATNTITYTKKEIPETKVPVYLKINGLPTAAKVKITLTGTNKTYVHETGNDNNFKFDDVVVGIYNIAAETYTDQGKNYITILQNPYGIDAGTIMPITITYKELTPPDPGKKIFAPYLDAAGLGNPVYPFRTLTDLYNTGVHSITLAFVLQSNEPCSGDFSGLANSDNFKKQITEYQNMGGYVIASFGGANGTYVEENCKDEEKLKNFYKQFITKYNIKDLDFDIEGGRESNIYANDLRNKVLAKIQQEDPSIKVSYTLAALPWVQKDWGIEKGGLSQTIIQNILKNATTHNLHISRINLMAMDYGNYYADPNAMGTAATHTAEAVFAQLQNEVYQHKTAEAIWAMIGLTPMIGHNDINPEFFTLTDTDITIDFAKNKGINFLSMWSINRDQPCDTSATWWVSATCAYDYKYTQAHPELKAYDFAKKIAAEFK